MNNLKIIVAIPCYNEAKTIAKVVHDFQRTLPQAKIIVFDNNSRDNSAEIAKNAGAQIEHVYKQGKGNVMREIFDKFDADLLVVVDGDDTYFANDAPVLIQTLIDNNCDMVVGNRLNKKSSPAFKRVNLIGNYLIASAINRLFGTKHQDVLSGFRIFGKRFINRVAVLTSEFEIEVELTLRALEEKLIIKEVPISYQPRPAESRTKLKPFRDGVRILITIAMILRDVYPLRLYGIISFFCFIFAFIAGILRLINYFGTITFPNTVLIGFLLIFIPAGMITLGIGLILSAVNTRFSEIKQILLRRK